MDREADFFNLLDGQCLHQWEESLVCAKRYRKLGPTAGRVEV